MPISILYMAGADLVLNTIRHRYWIVAAKSLIKSYIKNCVICSRFNCTEPFQLMGDLPVESISAARAFNDIEMDFTGIFCEVLFDCDGPCESLRLSVCLYVYKSMSFRDCYIFTRRSVSSSNCTFLRPERSTSKNIP